MLIVANVNVPILHLLLGNYLQANMPQENQNPGPALFMSYKTSQATYIITHTLKTNSKNRISFLLSVLFFASYCFSGTYSIPLG